jgi:uncharacterized zinc-type alcohol dehydrogenase-like protein
MIVHAYAATEPGGYLCPFEYELGPIEDSEVQVKIEYCGICYSDVHMTG